MYVTSQTKTHLATNINTIPTEMLNINPNRYPKFSVVAAYCCLKEQMGLDQTKIFYFKKWPETTTCELSVYNQALRHSKPISMNLRQKLGLVR